MSGHRFVCHKCGEELSDYSPATTCPEVNLSRNQTVCNQENGCYSELFGRDCWVADTLLKLIEVAFDPGEFAEPEAKAYEKVVKYCQELRRENKEPHFDDVIHAA